MNTDPSLIGQERFAGTRSADELERAIDDTRAGLDRTLDALKAKLSPRQRIQSAVNSAERYGAQFAKAATNAVLPGITTMIRMDHTHALAVFRRFRPGTSLRRKRALVANACLALEIHARLEEEIFYPTLREAIGPSDVLDKSVPEHDEMRVLIGTMRSMEPEDVNYDATFRALMRVVLRHVADEESTLLPRAEEAMSDRLGQLGLQMTRRRLELLRPHLGEVAATTARSFPVAAAAAAAGLLMLGWLALRPFRRSTSARRGA